MSNNKDKAADKSKAKEDAQIKADAKVKAEAESMKQACEKAQAEADAKAKAKAELNSEAETLGVKKSKIMFAVTKTKEDKRIAEEAYHRKKADLRLKKRIKKAKAPKLTPKQARKKHIKGILTHRQNYPKKTITQVLWELTQMKLGTWQKGKRMPKKGKTTYEEIVDD